MDPFAHLGKWLIILGILLVLLGGALYFFPKLPIGRLPGDIVFERGGVKVYFPWVTCLVASIVLSLVLYFLNK
jgi:hypothetical protein